MAGQAPEDDGDGSKNHSSSLNANQSSVPSSDSNGIFSSVWKQALNLRTSTTSSTTSPSEANEADNKSQTSTHSPGGLALNTTSSQAPKGKPHTQCPGTGLFPFRAYIEKEPDTTADFWNSFQTITFQLFYQKYSHEELRLADYNQGRKFGDIAHISNELKNSGANTGSGGVGSTTQSITASPSIGVFGSSWIPGSGAKTASSGTAHSPKESTKSLFSFPPSAPSFQPHKQSAKTLFPIPPVSSSLSTQAPKETAKTISVVSSLAVTQSTEGTDKALALIPSPTIPTENFKGEAKSVFSFPFPQGPFFAAAQGLEGSSNSTSLQASPTVTQSMKVAENSIFPIQSSSIFAEASKGSAKSLFSLPPSPPSTSTPKESTKPFSLLPSSIIQTSKGAEKASVQTKPSVLSTEPPKTGAKSLFPLPASVLSAETSKEAVKSFTLQPSVDQTEPPQENPRTRRRKGRNAASKQAVSEAVESQVSNQPSHSEQSSSVPIMGSSVSSKQASTEAQKSVVTNQAPYFGQPSGTRPSTSSSTESEKPQATTQTCYFGQPSGVLPSSSNTPEPKMSSPVKEEYKFTFSKREEVSAEQQLADHLDLLDINAESSQSHDAEVHGAPVFTQVVRDHCKDTLSQWGFFAGITDLIRDEKRKAESCVFHNVETPSSAFICGSQGSGKSHTLSCLLENCLMMSKASNVHTPLSGLVFHYDSFNSDENGMPCEAAYLASNPHITVRVLCSPTNSHTIRRTYEDIKNVKVEELRINETDLNTQRMMDLMAVDQSEAMPLYLHAIFRILRDMRLEQQDSGGSFDYAEFKSRVMDRDAGMTPAQLGPLNQRLDALESFMPKSHTITRLEAKSKKKEKKTKVKGTNWEVKPGHLTIVDLSCPCVTSENACALFNICLSLFMHQKTSTGRVIALDEAHKYMNQSTGASALTSTLLSTIRLQRHLGVRILISTQEPTIDPKLLDLCTITIVHRFHSPAWYHVLQKHLAGASSLSHLSSTVSSSRIEVEDGDGEGDGREKEKEKRKKVTEQIFLNHITKLEVGQALLFAPTALVGVKKNGGEDREGEVEMLKLDDRFLKIKVRKRLTADGGRSIMAK